MKKFSAFTLVELLVASTIFAVLMISLYSAFHTGMFGYRKIEEAIDISQKAGQILERINLDLRNSFVFSKDDAKFVGHKDSLSFLTIMDVFVEDEMKPMYSFVSYGWDGKALMRSCRKDKDSLNDGSALEAEEMGAGIKETSFEYGFMTKEGKLEWKNSWASNESESAEKAICPVAVKVKITIKDKIEKEFERTIFFPTLS